MRSFLLLVFTLGTALVAAAQTPTPTATSQRLVELPVGSPNFPADVLAKFRGKERIDLFLELDKTGRVKEVTAFGPWITCGKSDPIAEALQKAAVETGKMMIFPAGQGGDRSATMFYPVEGTMPPPPPVDAKDKRTGGVVNGHAISKLTPKVSSKAKKFGVTGSVSIEIVVDEEGKPITAKARSGHPLLLKESAEAACGARYTPTLFAGTPVKVSAILTYNFVP